jgi:hypothetical protein
MKITDSNRYILPGQTRFLHLATVQHAAGTATNLVAITRTFLCFADTLGGSKIYIEELNAAGQLEFIEDDRLVADIAQFLQEAGVLDITRPLLDDNTWLRNRGKT